MFQQQRPRRSVSRTRSALAACLASALVLSGCRNAPPRAEAPEPGDVAVAKVGEDTVWLSDVRREAVQDGLIGEGDAFGAGSPAFSGALASVVDEKLLAHEAVQQKLDRNPEARRRLLAAREKVLSDLAVENSVDKVVDDDAIRALYAEQQRLAARSDELRARQIVTATQAEGEAARKLVLSGQPFEAVAMAHSTDAATRFSGGDLGGFTLDALPGAYAAALKSARKGELVGPFQGPDGWVLVKVEARAPERPPSFDQARPTIVRFLTYEEIRKLLERLRERTPVQILGKAERRPLQEPASAPKQAGHAATAPSPPTRETPAPTRPSPARSSP